MTETENAVEAAELDTAPFRVRCVIRLGPRQQWPTRAAEIIRSSTVLYASFELSMRIVARLGGDCERFEDMEDLSSKDWI